MNGLVVVLYVFLGTFLGALLCVIPSLHIYNVAGIAVLVWMGAKHLIPYYAIAPFFMSLLVSMAFRSDAEGISSSGDAPRSSLILFVILFL